MTVLTFDPHTPTADGDRVAIAAQLDAILEAARSGDTERLANYHLYGPKFTKFDDMEPLERQEAEEARAGEDAIAAVENFTYHVEQLRIDVFGPTAVATFVLGYAFDADGQPIDTRARSTLVFVADGAEWRIAHEHLSGSSRTRDLTAKHEHRLRTLPTHSTTNRTASGDAWPRPTAGVGTSASGSSDAVLGRAATARLTGHDRAVIDR